MTMSAHASKGFLELFQLMDYVLGVMQNELMIQRYLGEMDDSSFRIVNQWLIDCYTGACSFSPQDCKMVIGSKW